jgi:hypothetical protein
MVATIPNLISDASKTTRQCNRGNLPGRRGSYAQAVWLQDQIIARVENDDVPPMAFASLARAWVELEDRKRILRGVPLPGQLRPDLDPLQLMKAVKRSRARKPIELAGSNGSGFAGPAEDLDPAPAPGDKTPPPKQATESPKPPAEEATRIQEPDKTPAE